MQTFNIGDSEVQDFIGLEMLSSLKHSPCCVGVLFILFLTLHLSAKQQVYEVFVHHEITYSTLTPTSPKRDLFLGCNAPSNFMATVKLVNKDQ